MSWENISKHNVKHGAFSDTINATPDILEPKQGPWAERASMLSQDGYSYSVPFRVPTNYSHKALHISFKSAHFRILIHI